MGVRRGWRIAVAVLATVGIASGVGGAAALLPAGTGGGGTRAAAVAPDDRPERELAVAAARAAGRRVEVLGSRSETRQVFAEPDGSFTMELSPEPVRVRQGGTWVAPDTTLSTRPDGTVAPAAVVLPVTFSGGGTAEPLVRLTSGQRRIELHWPDPLPVPALSGDTATYPDVFPGVDLRVRALKHGFSKVLAVRTRQAAADPRLARIRFDLTTVGLTAGANAYGGVSVRDAGGALFLSSSTVRMWDSPVPGVASRHATGRAEVAAGQLTVLPDRSLLADPAATYPVFIDPDFTPPFLGWTKVFSGHPTTNYWNGGIDDAYTKVGQCWNGRNECHGIGIARSFFQYEIWGLRGAQILGAEFNMHGMHSPDCNQPRPFRVFRTGPIDGNTTWNNQPGGWVGPLAEYNMVFCPPTWVGAAVGSTIDTVVRSGANVVTFALAAADEFDQLAWKRFDAVNLIVHYNWPPNPPSNVWTNVGQGPSLGCVPGPDQAYAFSPQPTLHATLSDRDGQNLEAEFEWWKSDGLAKVGSLRSAFQPNNTAFAATVPAGDFSNGSRIKWRVRAGDRHIWGPWSGWCHVTVDQTPPGRPGVTSTDYPEGQVGGHIGKTGAFTVTSTDTDLLGFQWSLNFQDLPVVDPNSPQFVRASGGAATIRVTPTKDGPNQLYVRAVDRAFNVSPVYARPDGNGGWVPGGYGFAVGSAVPEPIGYWPLDGRHLAAVAPDASGRGHDGTVVGIHPAAGAAWDAGRVGDALRFDGVSGHVTAGSGPAVRTDSTFSVAAWVRLGAVSDTWRVAVSQDGSRTAGFYLRFAKDVGTWSFDLMKSDVDNASADRVWADAPAQVGVWTHLAGTYDRGTGQIRLYVNGAAQSRTALHPTPWAAGGPLQIGRGRLNGAPSQTSYWVGSVDDVKVWDRLIVEPEIRELANTPTVEEAFYPYDEADGTVARDVSGNYRDGTLGGGASRVPGLVGDGAVAFDGVDDAVTAIRQAVRTDGSFTVTARARLDAAGAASQTVVGQDGPSSSGFALQYRGATGRWQLLVSPADSSPPTWLRVESAAPAQPLEWVHLAAVYDAAAGQLRLYVNGAEHVAPARTTRHVPGNLVVGRARQSGAPVAFFGGRIDDVHVYTGVRTKEQIVADNVNPVTARTTVYTGQLSRYANHSSRHFVTTGPVPPDYHFEHSLGMMALDRTPDTAMLYSCQAPGGQFASLQPGCEGTGNTLLGEIGLLYVNPPEGMPAVAVYRCAVPSTGSRFVSTHLDCEGWVNEGRLGHTLAYRKLIRYVKEYPPHDHWTTVVGPTAGYRPEGTLGVVALTGEPGTVPLMSCVDGTDEFVSTDPGCDGKTVRYWIGGIWTGPPAYAPESRPLYACRTTPSGELFTSLDEFCEGRTVTGPLGYVITKL